MKGECGIVGKSGLASTEAEKLSGLSASERKVLSSEAPRSGVL